MKFYKRKKKSPCVGVIETPIYHRRVQLYPTVDDALMEVSCCEELAEGNFGALTLVVCTENHGEFIGLAFNDDRYMTPETVAHEAVHVAWFTLDLAGVQVTVDNHEQLAYLVGYYVEEITQFVETYRKQAINEELKDGQ